MDDTLFTAKKIVNLRSVSSTNTYALELLRQSSVPEGTTIIAAHQTHGRGQKGNEWSSKAGLNLLCSIIYYPTTISSDKLFYLSKLSSLAVYDCLSTLLPDTSIQIKWPNDILVEKKKIAGILIENQLQGKKLKAAIIGIGLNVNQTHFQTSTDYGISSLKSITGRVWDLMTVQELLFQALEKYYLMLRNQKNDLINQDYLNKLYGYRQKIEFKTTEEQFEAEVKNVDEAGRLIVLRDGNESDYNFKEIRFILKED